MAVRALVLVSEFALWNHRLLWIIYVETWNTQIGVDGRYTVIYSLILHQTLIQACNPHVQCHVTLGGGGGGGGRPSSADCTYGMCLGQSAIT